MPKPSAAPPGYRTLIRSPLIALAVLALLYAFICSINVMGRGLIVLAHCPGTTASITALFARAANPLAALFVGVLVTSIVQSSSFTTSLIVGLVASGQLDVAHAVPFVMGANIGTSVTNMLVSLGHVSARLEFRRAFGAAIVHDIFNLLTVAVLFPLELKTRFLTRSATAIAATFVPSVGPPPRNLLKAATEPVIQAFQYLLEHLLALQPHYVGALMGFLGLVGLFASLILLVRTLKRLVLAHVEAFFARYFFRNWLSGLTLGLITTAIVQSSSVTTSLVVPLAAAGVLRLRQIFPYTVGANIGTTVTAIIAGAASGTSPGLAIAFAHFLFNVTGACLFLPLSFIPVSLAAWYARLAATRRALALLYILVVFFLLPLLCIMLAR